VKKKRRSAKIPATYTSPAGHGKGVMFRKSSGGLPELFYLAVLREYDKIAALHL
jgi:hypothetical protein